MRITEEAKSETRQRILDAASSLFVNHGWQSTTTRAIAVESGIAAGTLFNYFATKETIAARLIADRLERAGQAFRAGRRPEDSLESDLFLLIWSGLRSLGEFRKFLGPAAGTILSPLARQTLASPGDRIRADHLELVQTVIASHGHSPSLTDVTMQLYWTLYLGVLAFWAADDSPGQEDSLTLLDQSLKLFVAAL